jgi:cytochrome c553
MNRRLRVNLVVCLLVGAASIASAADADVEAIEKGYASDIRPLVTRYCGKCHSDELAEADIDLLAFATFADVRKEPEVWQKVGEMLGSGQMPPPAAKQPSDAERAKLRDWVRRFLKEAAKRDAGDPGPVVLRRLNNAEYTYVLRDLTGVESLQPAREFPADGAAGEGFTNTGNALVMSPSLVSKYLDAAKEVASHAVLTPDGMRFSTKTTRRDWTEELLGEIRDFYAQFSDSAGGSQVNLQGIVFDTNGGGRLPVEKYLAATLAERDALTKGTKTIEAVARERGLSPKYLGALWRALTADVDRVSRAEPPASSEGKTRPAEGRSALESQSTGRPSLLLDGLRARWRTAKPDDAPALAAEVARWQLALWRFTSVGHIGKAGGPKAWMEPVSPITARQELRMKLPAPTDGKDVVLYLAASDAGDGNEQDFVVWERPRLVAPGRPDLLLRDVRPVTRELAARRDRIFASAAECLAAAAEASAIQGNVDVMPLAKKHGVEADVLAAWLDYLGIGAGGPVKIGTPLTRQVQSLSGYDFIKGWVGDDALSVLANSSDQHVRIPGNMQPHSVAVHPSPSLAVAAGWRSPAAATLRIEGLVQHAHPECGNGVVWSLELRRGNTRQRLAAGTSQGATKVKVGPLEKIAVQAGDLISLVIGPRDGNHACDLTAIDMTLHDGTREWDLAREISPDVLAGNPHKDGHGSSDVWHFYSEPAAGSTGHVIPAGSLLARWQAAPTNEEKQRLAAELERLLQAGATPLPKDSPDAALRQQLTSLGGPLLAAALQALASKPSGPAEPPADPTESAFGLDPAQFGKHPSGTAVEPASLCVRAPSVVEIRLPADLVAGAEFTTAGTLHADTGKEGSVQLQLLTSRPESVSGLQATAVAETNASGPWTSNNRGVSHATPVVVTEESAARQRMESAFDDFRRLFPAALCYTKIVPVDEVVTLTLFYREDDHLRRLMLDDEQTARINRLWDELHFISHDALTLVDAFEQLWQYATQDADPKVFEPLRKPIQDRAAAFRKQLVDAEPKHLDAVLRFASLAYRRPLTEAETRDLAGLYRSLRKQELGHDEATRLLLARVFVSPAFLYRAEKSSRHAPREENRAQPDSLIAMTPVSDHELATRLSFFLWSTAPDAELHAAASNNKLRSGDVLTAQAHRMLKDARVRRLATEFACQWLHIYEFDSHDEKSEATFPTFAGLRGAMYEESIRFFTDLFQRDGSILELLDADHTFVNEDLAKHYGIAGVTGPEWRRVDGLKQLGRGGILGMATTLAKQSGASRTSPILRGNWVSEVLLSEKLPRPPKDVPQLPDVVPAGLTERQLIEQHSSVPACAKCHARIDPFGFALEDFDGIGRRRGNAPGLPTIDTRGNLLDGTAITGLDGLRSYLLTTRRDDFVRQFCRKLLGYALGRAVQLSDEPLLDELQRELEKNDFRFSAALETIVVSKQFRHRRLNEVVQEGP